VSDLLDLDTAPPPRSRSRRGAVVVLVAALVLVGALAGGFVALKALVHKPALLDYPGPGSGSVTVVIEPDATLGQIGTTLANQGVVASRQAFVSAANLNAKATSIAPGTYQLQSHMKASDAVDYLIGNAHRVSTHVVVPEGFEADQVLQALARTGKFTTDDLRAAARDVQALGLPSWGTGHLEGFLFPATYDFEPGTTAQRALAQMVTRFGAAAKAVQLESKAASLKMTAYQILIIASIVEREGKNPGDYGKIARVIYNRLAKDMPLQMDSTINYARDVRKVRLSLADIADDTPYNTYKHKGLPPTPIASPGDVSLRAALAPTPGPWLYFVAFPDGTTKFATRYADFINLKKQAGLLTPAPAK
jgi:UPF0755 protein